MCVCLFKNKHLLDYYSRYIKMEDTIIIFFVLCLYARLGMFFSPVIPAICLLRTFDCFFLKKVRELLQCTGCVFWGVADRSFYLSPHTLACLATYSHQIHVCKKHLYNQTFSTFSLTFNFLPSFLPSLLPSFTASCLLPF